MNTLSAATAKERILANLRRERRLRKRLPLNLTELLEPSKRDIWLSCGCGCASLGCENLLSKGSSPSIFCEECEKAAAVRPSTEFAPNTPPPLPWTPRRQPVPVRAPSLAVSHRAVGPPKIDPSTGLFEIGLDSNGDEEHPRLSIVLPDWAKSPKPALKETGRPHGIRASGTGNGLTPRQLRALDAETNLRLQLPILKRFDVRLFMSDREALRKLGPRDVPFRRILNLVEHYVTSKPYGHADLVEHVVISFQQVLERSMAGPIVKTKRRGRPTTAECKEKTGLRLTESQFSLFKRIADKSIVGYHRASFVHFVLRRWEEMVGAHAPKVYVEIGRFDSPRDPRCFTRDAFDAVVKACPNWDNVLTSTKSISQETVELGGQK